MVEKQVDILIIGGGLTGATLMLALKGLGFSTLLVESKPFSDKVDPDFDARTLALSLASVRILDMLGIWAPLQQHATAIETIHVSNQHYFGASRLQNDATTPLGYVVEMQHINQTLHNLLDKSAVLAPATLKALDQTKQVATVLTDSGTVHIQAQLIVAADGAESAVRQLCALPVTVKNYQQQAVVANIGLAKSHGNRAFERFTAHGPLAMLPMQGPRMALVWAMPPEDARQMMAASDAHFLKALQGDFGYRLGRLVKVGQRFVYPLKQALMPQQVSWPLVFVGNAAHTLHPVAGQGFNLGLRDVATLAQCIAQQGLSAAMLTEYMQLRRHDQQMITHLTDGLIQLFTSRIPGVGLMRNMGLMAFDNLPSLKHLFARYALGFGGLVPDLACEIALKTREQE
ncbi:MAG: 2-octaprenyl-6-methoxyphenyl hydroxylase [Legionellales bacterium]